MFNQTFKASLAILAFAATAPANASSILMNGDFETTSGIVGTFGTSLDNLGTSGHRNWDVYSSVPGWETTVGRGIEIQTNPTLKSIDAHSGTHYVELDSHRSGSNSTMTQEFSVGPGRYLLEFWYSPRTKDAGTNGISFSVMDSALDSLLVGGVTGPDLANGTKRGDWTQFTFGFTVDAGASPLSLNFSAVGKQDTLGGFLDDISITAVPVPATLPLLLGALGGLGIASRRRRKAD